MITHESTLDEILSHVWGMLGRGANDGKHAFHFPVLGTLGDGKVQQRTVVLRKIDATHRLLYCYTDVRTPKVKELLESDQASWLFYDPTSKEQIRASARMTIHQEDATARELWATIPPDARRDYLGPQAAGTVSDNYTANLPEEFVTGEATKASTEKGLQNFCVLTGKVSTLDFLALRKGGHIRAKFTWRNGRWQSAWLAP